MAQTIRPLLIGEDIQVRFGSLIAVDGVSLSVNPGEVLGIGGANGAGKTTLFDVLTGVRRPNSGRLMFCGHDVSVSNAVKMAHLGVARTFQLNAIFDSLSVRDNILVSSHFGHRNRFMASWRFSKRDHERADGLIEQFALQTVAADYAGSITVYQKKLLMLANAMATEPKLLLLDEPVGGLTEDEIEGIKVVTQSIVESGVSVILIEHVMPFLISLSQRVLIINQGKVIYEGDPHQMASNELVIESFLGKEAAQNIKSTSMRAAQ